MPGEGLVYLALSGVDLWVWRVRFMALLIGNLLLIVEDEMLDGKLRIKGALQQVEFAAVAPGGGVETGVDRGFGRRQQLGYRAPAARGLTRSLPGAVFWRARLVRFAGYVGLKDEVGLVGVGVGT